MAEQPKTIRIEARGSRAVPLDKLEPFQDDLKHIEKTEYEKGRKSLIELGVSLVFHVWKNEGHEYIIDGHQRRFILKHMKEVEGWAVPPLPVCDVQAKSFAEAKRKVLAAASVYGKTNPDGLIAFMKANDIPFEDVVATFDLPGIDFADIAKSLEMVGDSIEVMQPEDTPKMTSGSDGVKQVQLFFGTEAHAEFMTKVDALSKVFGKENVTDTVLECVRESYKVRVPAAQ